MAYTDIVEMATNATLRTRFAAAAAAEGEDDPSRWAADNAWHLAASPGWADAWAYAEDTATVNQNPDTGMRNDVITDGMILSAVQARQAALATP